MKICLIGQNLTNLILASVFEEKKLNVDIFLNKKIHKNKQRKKGKGLGEKKLSIEDMKIMYQHSMSGNLF